MKFLIGKILVIIIIGLTLNSCKQNEVDGIIIGHTLYENQTYSKNKELRQLISQSLSKDEKALENLNSFWCGGGAGCYDLGFIVTQIIYRLGESEVIEMVNRLDKEEIRGIESLIRVGLEYGDNDGDGQMDNKQIENEFPELQIALKRINKQEINKVYLVYRTNNEDSSYNKHRSKLKY